MLRFAKLPAEFLIKLPYSTLVSDIAVLHIGWENLAGLKCIMVRYSEIFHTSRLDLDIDLSDLEIWTRALTEVIPCCL